MSEFSEVFADAFIRMRDELDAAKELIKLLEEENKNLKKQLEGKK